MLFALEPEEFDDLGELRSGPSLVLTRQGGVVVLEEGNIVRLGGL